MGKKCKKTLGGIFFDSHCRSQSAKEAKPSKPLKVASDLIDNISREELSKLQKESMVEEYVKTVWSKVEDEAKDNGIDSF